MDLERECQIVQDAKCYRVDVEKVEQGFLINSNNLLTIKRRSDFRRIYHRGTRVFSHLLIVYVLRNRVHQTRIGISVSKKIGCAVERNRVRRIIKEACFHMVISIKKDIVIVAKPSIKNLKMQDVWKDLYRLLEKNRDI